MQVLGAEDVEALLKHLPSAADIAALIGPASPPCSGQSKLDKQRNTADRYLRLMAEIPRVHDRLALMLGMTTLDAQVQELSALLNTVGAACEAMQQSRPLLLALALVRACGNALNATSPALGRASGFKLSALERLSHIKVTTQATTVSVPTKNVSRGREKGPGPTNLLEYVALRTQMVFSATVPSDVADCGANSDCRGELRSRQQHYLPLEWAECG